MSTKTPVILPPADLSFLLPLENENAWTNLAAALIASDPQPIRELLNLPHGALAVRREATSSKTGTKDRPDLTISIDGHVRVVIEAKLLALLGTEQLERYEQSVPVTGGEEHTFVAVSLARLPLDTSHAPRWRSISWEELVSAHESSEVDWVRSTAVAWSEHLRSNLPRVDGATRWNDIPDTEDLMVALRCRAVYLWNRVDVPDGSIARVLPVATGGKWVTTVSTPIADSPYQIQWEIEEQAPVRQLRGKRGKDLGGPSVRFAVLLRARTTVGFDWGYLLHLWNTYLAHESIPWVKGTARPKVAHDIAGLQTIRALGAPRNLGIGYGEAQAQAWGNPMFGARFRLSPTATLDEIADELSKVALIGSLMAKDPVVPRFPAA